MGKKSSHRCHLQIHSGSSQGQFEGEIVTIGESGWEQTSSGIKE